MKFTLAEGPAYAIPGPTVKSSLPCAAHKYHSPKPLYSELHHIVPQAWQLTWQPPGTRPGRLWSGATIPLCATGHRNVHRVIETLMMAGSGSEDVYVAEDLYYDHGGVRVGVAEFSCAMEALVRFKAAGGSLEFLRDAGQFGAA